MTQAIPFDTSKGGHIPNLCLDNVRRGYGISNKYGSAWEAWQHTEQHPGRTIPDGLDVPLYYSYTATIDGVTQNYGHINVRLSNGTVWSDGNIYASINAYTANHAPKFVGWGESVNDFKVINEGGNMPQPISPGDLDRLIKGMLGRDPTAEELNNPDYLANAALAIETFWNNGGEARFKTPPTDAQDKLNKVKAIVG